MLQCGKVLLSDIHWIDYCCPGDITVWRGLIIRHSLNNLMVPWWCYATVRHSLNNLLVSWWCYSVVRSYCQTIELLTGALVMLQYGEVLSSDSHRNCGRCEGHLLSQSFLWVGLQHHHSWCCGSKIKKQFERTAGECPVCPFSPCPPLPTLSNYSSVCRWCPYSCVMVSPYFVSRKMSCVVNIVRCLAFPSNSRHEGFEGLAVVGVKTAGIWNVTQYGLVRGYQFLPPEVGDCRFLWNGCISLPISIESHPILLFLFIS